MKKYKFKLYIVKDNPSSRILIEQIKYVFQNILKDGYYIDIVDILEHPELAVKDKVIASPTLIKEFPYPQKRLIGQFNDKKKLTSGLNLLVNDN